MRVFSPSFLKIVWHFSPLRILRSDFWGIIFMRGFSNWIKLVPECSNLYYNIPLLPILLLINLASFFPDVWVSPIRPALCLFTLVPQDTAGGRRNRAAGTWLFLMLVREPRGKKKNLTACPGLEGRRPRRDTGAGVFLRGTGEKMGWRWG